MEVSDIVPPIDPAESQASLRAQLIIAALTGSALGSSHNVPDLVARAFAIADTTMRSLATGEITGNPADNRETNPPEALP